MDSTRSLPMPSDLVGRLLRRADHPYDFTDIAGLEADLREAASALRAGAEPVGDGLLWYAVKTPGADADISFVDNLGDADDLAGGDPALIIPLYTRPQPATPASGWMPIESAPRDGTRVILGRPDDDGDGGASVCGFWLDALEDGVDYMGHDGGFTDADYQVFQPGRSFGAESYRYAESQPTHWQPLPTPPASKGGE